MERSDRVKLSFWPFIALIALLGLQSQPASGVTLSASIVSATSLSPYAGGQMTVTVDVTNSDLGDATNVNCSLVVTAGGSSVYWLNTSPSASLPTLASGATATFTYTFAILQPGIVTFVAQPVGTDCTAGCPPMTPCPTVTDTVQFPISVNPPVGALAASTAIASVSPFVGGEVTITFTVTNAGLGDVVDLEPSLVISAGSEIVSLKSGPTPAYLASLAPAADQTFIWVFNITGSGTVNYTASVAAIDNATGSPLSAAASGTVVLPGLPPAALPLAVLAADLDLFTSSPYVGGDLAVTLTVTNVGSGTAISVYPELNITSGLSLVYLKSGPTPTSTNFIIPGTNEQFTWIFGINGSGTVYFTARANGLDLLTRVPVTATDSGSIALGGFLPSSTLTFLTADLDLFTSSPYVGGDLAVTLTVTNAGSGTAISVYPELNITSGLSLVYLKSGPTPGSVSSISPDTFEQFTWVFGINGTGTVYFEARANGLDSITYLPLTATDSGSIALTGFLPSTTLANLTADLAIFSSSPYVGEDLAVILTVTNVGSGTAISVYPELNITSGVSLVYLKSGPLPTSTGFIFPDSNGQFTWIFGISGTGTVYFEARANGQDSITYLPLTATDSGFFLLADAVPSSSLMAALSFYPPSPFIGDTLSVMLTVTSTGAGGAIDLVPNLAMSSTVLVAYFSNGPVPGNLSLLPAGTAQTFTWFFDVVGSGTARFNAEATGLDQGTLRPLSATATGSVTARTISQVIPPSATVPVLAVAIAMSTTSPFLGDSFTVTLTATNTGQGDVINLQPWLKIPGGRVIQDPMALNPVPSSSTQLGTGDSITFLWTLLATEVGFGWLDGGIVGSETVTGLTAASVSATEYFQVWPLPPAGSIPGVLPGTESVAETSPTLLTLLQVIALSNQLTGSAAYRAAMAPLVQVVLKVTSDQPVALTASSVPRIEQGAPIVSLVSGPLPAGPVPLEARASVTFTWLYSISGAGRVAFDARTQGTDSAHGNPVEAGASESITVEPGGLGAKGTRVIGGRAGTINPSRGEKAVILVKPSAPGQIRIRIYSLDGKLVRELAAYASGSLAETVIWDGLDSSGSRVPPGAYPALIEAPGVKSRELIGVMR